MTQRVTLITGISRGIGRAIAQRLARDEGHSIIGLARSPDAMQGLPGAFYRVDLADAAATAEVLERILDSHRVDHLVNNAGRTINTSLLDSSLEAFDDVMAVNVRAALQCAQACVPGMRERGYGRIVNISSRAALGMKNRNAYAAAKGGMISLTRSWALELGPQGITVNAVAPGPIRTELYERNNPMSEEERQRLATRIPVGRLGRPEDVAAAAAFFLSEDAGFITGQTLYACGGLSIGGAAF